jgi:hypothetical protein
VTGISKGGLTGWTRTGQGLCFKDNMLEDGAWVLTELLPGEKPEIKMSSFLQDLPVLDIAQLIY